MSFSAAATRLCDPCRRRNPGCGASAARCRSEPSPPETRRGLRRESLSARLPRQSARPQRPKVLELVHDAEPELGALVLLDPEAKHLLHPVLQDAERDVHRLVPDETFVPDLTSTRSSR